ncbi:DUF1697 domain-containing protein [Cellulomonas soli]
MTAVIALLRAVNVAGRTVPAARLREIAEQLGHQHVTTHVNSGNLVLVPAGARAEADKGTPGDGDVVGRADAVASGLARALEDALGFAVPTIARDRASWDEIVDSNPFPEQAVSDPSHMVLVCWDGTPDPARVAALDPSAYGNEQVVWHGREAYVWYPDGIGRSKLTLDVLQRASGLLGTGRNWRTVSALQALAAERD